MALCARDPRLGFAGCDFLKRCQRFPFHSLVLGLDIIVWHGIGKGDMETYVAFVKTRSNTAPLLDCHRDGLRIGVFD